ncbi:MAG: AfsR/SARP family transcriptional regulator [Acidimicrobiales bacterium]
MLGVAKTANLSDTIVGLCYLASIVTGLFFLARATIRKLRQRGQPSASPPAQEGWRRLVAPMTAPTWEAPIRPAPATPRVRTTSHRDEPAQPKRAVTTVVDLTEDSAGDQALTLAPGPASTGPASTGPVGTADLAKSLVRESARLLAPARPVLTEPFVTVLGAVDLHCAKPPDRRIVKELAVYLALHRDRPRRAEELLEALWPPRDELARERDPETLHQAASRLRRCLGPEAFPDANLAGGYALAESVQCDWDVFHRRVSDAAGEDATAKLGSALSLVSGPPFSGVRPDSYTWVWSELWASRITAAVVDAAHRLIGLSLSSGDHAMAEWAAGQGLCASPAEELLHEDRLGIAAAARDLTRFERVWAEAKAVLGEQAESGPVGDTYRRLRRELRGSA